MKTKNSRWTFLIVIAATIVSGCSTNPAKRDIYISPEERAERTERGYVYYLDGAGGGGKTNWASGVRNGLLKAGYDGAGEMFNWETGHGVVADQESSNKYKKEKAAEVAWRIKAFEAEHPDVPITLIGFSAGTAVATFALEALPEDVQVSDVILLGGSLSTTHDLTNALKRIENRLYIFTSHKDAVLQLAVPWSGTADRDADTTQTVGVEGPKVPEGASEETRRLYANKVITIPRTAQSRRFGDKGGHTDAVGEDFVRHYVAPLVKTTSRQQFSIAKEESSGKVPNPDYQRWANFEPGSWTVLEGTQTVNGKERPARIKVTLVEEFPASLIIERVDLLVDTQKKTVPYPQYVYVKAYIEPSEHPATHPARRVTELGTSTVSVKSNELQCSKRTTSVAADFYSWGRDPQATITHCDGVPGEIVQLNLSTRFNQSQLDFNAKLVDFYSTASE